MNDYDPISKAQDATKFAESRFGQHYLARLAMVRDNHYTRARQLQKEGAEDHRVAAEIARADEIEGELGYFAQAQVIATNPTMIDRIKKNLKRKSKEAA